MENVIKVQRSLHNNRNAGCATLVNMILYAASEEFAIALYQPQICEGSRAMLTFDAISINMLPL
jgi:hypothetical protein